MAVFMYAPGFKIYVKTEHNGTLDISDDVTQGNIVRRSSGVSSLSFTLQNTRRKYDGIFVPNDRVIVMMKRITWMRVFTGYLNSVPLVTAWPMAVPMTASCSLKRLQYYYWDPALASSLSMVTAAMTATKNTDDGGTANAIVALLNQVAGWPPANVHIAGIPQAALQWSYGIAKNVAASLAEADQLAQQFYAVLGANGIVSGQLQGGVVKAGALKAGTYGGQAITQAQANVAVQVFNVGAAMKATAQDEVVALATAYQESRLGAVTSGPGSADSVGVFQQRPSQGWGTAAQLSDVNYAAKAFFAKLMQITGRANMTVGQQAQLVQRSADPTGSTYQQWSSMATQIVNQLMTGQQSGASLSAGDAASALQGSGSTANSGSNNTAPAASAASATKTGKTTGNAILQTAQDLVAANPKIAYKAGPNISPPNTPAAKVTSLDASGFVQWVYFHATGKTGCPRTATEQLAWCAKSGSAPDVTTALSTQGALLFTGQSQHVEISVGDGKNTIGAHAAGSYAGQVAIGSTVYTSAGLMPNVDYSGSQGQQNQSSAASGGTTINVNPLNAGIQLSTGSAMPWYNPNDPFDALFGSSPYIPDWSSADIATAESLTGPRALLPDSPLLPYIKNLVDACMRNYCSAPNGDFIAWYPDYYGLWGTAAIMQIEPIELQDFNVWWDDTNLVTHQYVVCPSGVTNKIDLATGTIGNWGPLLAVTTTGVASIDVPAIMQGLFGLEPTAAEAKAFIDWVYKKFGARPNFQEIIGPFGGQGEFFAALTTFMQSWAYQYNADVPITFMPELWPGMLIQIPSFGFQAYVTTVTHSWRLGPGGGYTTSVNICAPARLPGNEGNSQNALIGMPLAGGLKGVPAPPTVRDTTPLPGQSTFGPQNKGAAPTLTGA
jgi:hypothetical protein